VNLSISLLARCALPMLALLAGVSSGWAQGATSAPAPAKPLRPIFVLNSLDATVSVIDLKNWQTVATIPTLGPGFFLRSHENSPFAWVDSMMSPTARDTLQVIDKRSLEVVARVRPEPGKTFAHVEFDRHGRYVIASLMEKDGALIFLDAATFKEIKRLPASKPIGKYNLFNKIQRSEGTSH